MGGGTSRQEPDFAPPKPVRETKVDLKDHERWRDDKNFEDDGTLVFNERPEYQELRNMLDETIGRHFLGEFAEKEHSAELFRAWFDIEEYRAVPTPDYRRCEARHIYNKYIREGAPEQLGHLTSDIVQNFKKVIVDEKCANITEFSFTGLQHTLFRELVENTYARFKASEAYKMYKKEKRDSYNQVLVDDFEYLKLLGQGGFGKVCCVRKISTGKFYAMKIIKKKGLVDMHKGRGDRAQQLEKMNIERNVIARARFPFIVTMDYAFQTESSLMLAMELVPGGDLESYMRTCPNKRLTEAEMLMVGAEVALALRHLHSLNYLYRDLKPENVLLTVKGHCKLADMGLVARINDAERGGKDKTVKRVNLTTEDVRHGDIEDLEKPIGRRRTLCGTFGYRAPELLVVGVPDKTKRQEYAERIANEGDTLQQDIDKSVEVLELGEGYGASVDWWSLGALVFELVSGTKYFDACSGNDICQFDSEEAELRIISKRAKKKKKDAGITLPHQKMKKKIAEQLSPNCRNFIDELLHMNPAMRLGVVSDTAKSLLDHPFINQLDVLALLRGELASPLDLARIKTKGQSLFSGKKAQFASFSDLDGDVVTSAELAEEFGLQKNTSSEDVDFKKYFRRWNYVSKHALRAEFNAQKAIISEAHRRMNLGWDATFLPDFSLVAPTENENTSSK